MEPASRNTYWLSNAGVTRNDPSHHKRPTSRYLQFILPHHIALVLMAPKWSMIIFRSRGQVDLFIRATYDDIWPNTKPASSHLIGRKSDLVAHSPLRNPSPSGVERVFLWDQVPILWVIQPAKTPQIALSCHSQLKASSTLIRPNILPKQVLTVLFPLTIPAWCTSTSNSWEYRINFECFR